MSWNSDKICIGRLASSCAEMSWSKKSAQSRKVLLGNSSHGGYAMAWVFLSKAVMVVGGYLTKRPAQAPPRLM